MDLLMNTFFELVSHLPKLLSWWLYSPEKTKRNVHVSVSARAGSVEVWCDKAQAKFSIWVEFKNNNAFPIEIDRAEASGTLHAARLTATNLFGMPLKKGESGSLHLEGRIDDINLELANKAPENESVRTELRAIIVNKYHTIRDFRVPFDNLMCKLINKRPKQSPETSNS